MTQVHLARAVATLAIVLVMADAVAAQTLVSGSIAGSVRDTSGAVLPGVTVEAASPALIEKTRAVVTDEQGQYKIIDLRPGPYSVTFSLAGFASVRRDGIELTTGFTATVNAELRVGSVEETITVTGASPIVDTQNVRSQNVLTRELLDTIPTGKSLPAYASLTLGATSGQDVGGTRGELNTVISIHGNRGTDMKQMVDGMPFHQMASSGAGTSRYYMVNQALAQEVVLETGGMSAESTTGGVQMNVVPKDGGNRFTTYINASGSHPSLQSNNLTDDLRARGATSMNDLREIYDIGGGFGGPIKRDRLWFYTAHRKWGASEYMPGNYFNLTPHTLFYTPDLSRRAYQDVNNQDHSVRFTWQAASKHKFTAYTAIQNNCLCYIGVDGNQSPEAAEHEDYWPISMTQATWTYPATGRLLFQGGATFGMFGRYARRVPETAETDIQVTELSTGYVYGSRVTATAATPTFGPTEYGLQDGSQNNVRFSMSYITGSHAFKVGMFYLRGIGIRDFKLNDPPVSYSFRKATPEALPTPVSVTYFASPHYAKNQMQDLGIYIQDQWTISRLTLNLGLRYENFNAWVPAQHRPAGPFVGAFDFARIDDIPNWKDINPRVGAAYDIFGTGRTAVKVSLGRYQAAQGSDIAIANNPANAIVTAASRTWNDANRDYVPQESELGPLSNNQFGSVVVNTRYDSEIITGWANRPYNWQGAASVQQQLRPGLAVLAAYYRTWYGNFAITDNLSQTPAAFDPFCVTAPADSRLPGGGGYQLCDLFNINRASFGQNTAGNLVRPASEFGKQTEVYDGLEFSFTSRFGRGGLVSGGVSTGQTVVDNCVQVDYPGQLQTGATIQPLAFCRNTIPWAGQTQVKLNGAYPLPWWGLQASAVFQNIPGVPILANRTFTNAEIAGSLGRNLSSCPSAVGACTATQSIAMIEPNSLREDRLTQVDARLTKTFQLGGVRLQGMFDVYNIFNENSVLTRNNTFGATWGRPTRILGARLVKFGAQLDF